MRKRTAKFAPAGIIALFLLLLSGCTSGLQGDDPAKVKVNLITVPEAVSASQPVKLKAEVTGLTATEGVNVQFDIRKADNSGLPDLKNAVLGKDGLYETDKTFEQAGSYNVYIHVYRGELHITKKKELTVS